MSLTLHASARCPTCKRPYRKSDKAKAYRAALRAGKKRDAEKDRVCTRKLRAACMKRAGAYCECGCVRSFWMFGSHLDHFLGGSGRRKQKQSLENCWMLTWKCHAARQANLPSAAHWNERFAAHCRKHGYPVLAHVEHAPVPRRSA